MARNKHIETPPKPLSKKIRKVGGPTPEQAILRALNAAEELVESYQGWAVDDLTKLLEAFRKSQGATTTRAQIVEMFEITHGIRGEGGSFGFPVVSVIADSLCKFLEERQHLGVAELEVIKVHILAMQAVFRQKLQGSQPGLEAELRQLLTLLRDKMGNRL